MKKLTIGYNTYTEEYIISQDPTGRMDRRVTYFRESDLEKNVRDYLVQNDLIYRKLNIIVDKKSKETAQISNLIKILQKANKKSISLL